MELLLDFPPLSLPLSQGRRTKEQNKIMLTMDCLLNQSMSFSLALPPIRPVPKTKFLFLRNDFYKNCNFCAFQLHLLEQIYVCDRAF